MRLREETRTRSWSRFVLRASTGDVKLDEGSTLRIGLERWQSISDSMI